MQRLRTSRSAILAPGGNNNADVPLLMYAGLAVRRRGGEAHPITWEFSGGRDFRQQRGRVTSQVASAIDETTAATGAAPVVIGKSLGSLAAPLVADRGLAGWPPQPLRWARSSPPSKTSSITSSGRNAVRSPAPSSLSHCSAHVQATRRAVATLKK